MPGFAITMLKIEDAEVVATSGKTHHPLVTYSGNPADKVSGMVFAITPEELAHADAYEVSDYRRDRVVLASGLSAWVYVAADSAASKDAQWRIVAPETVAFSHQSFRTGRARRSLHSAARPH